MTLKEVYIQGKMQLQKAGIETPAFDAVCLFEKVFKLDRQGLILHGGKTAQDAEAEKYIALIARRAQGEPLQYILGKWTFLGMELHVGTGVLVPREETELLVETALGLLAGKFSPCVIDLCAGTGAVALGIAQGMPDAEVCAAEYYPEAFRYLQKNIAGTGFPVKAVQMDILAPESVGRFSGFDAVLSNPPYIASGELPGLQREVQREPQTALDGGKDGLLFYRGIAKLWLPKLKSGGIAAVEVGEAQAEAVMDLFREAGMKQVRAERDFNGILRVVSGINSD